MAEATPVRPVAPERNHAPASALQLMTPDNTASLENASWADIDGLRPGFRLVEADGAGCLVLTDAVFQPDGRVANFRVEVPPEQPVAGTDDNGNAIRRYLPGQWLLLVPTFRAIDEANYLPKAVRATVLLPELLTAFRDAWLSEISDSASRLNHLRDPDHIDAELLDRFLNLIGNFMDVTDWTEDDRRRLAEELSHFYEVSGTEKYIRFISFVRNVVLEARVLWTDDYATFDVAPRTDSWYRTNRIRLEYDYERFAGTNFDDRALTRLFNRVAPIHDVLHEIIGTSRGEATFSRHALGHDVAKFVGGNQ